MSQAVRDLQALVGYLVSVVNEVNGSDMLDGYMNGYMCSEEGVSFNQLLREYKFDEFVPAISWVATFREEAHEIVVKHRWGNEQVLMVIPKEELPDDVENLVDTDLTLWVLHKHGDELAKLAEQE